MKEKVQSANHTMDAQTVGDLVARDYRIAEVFERYGIDFCCGGKTDLATACREQGIDPDELRRELRKAAETPDERGQNYGEWDLPLLADYIVSTHHAYLKGNTAGIAAHLHKIAQVHGALHPEVPEIAEIFDKIAADLALHLHYEEELLFPAIKKIVTLESAGGSGAARDIEALQASIASLCHEHDEIGQAIHEIRRLAHAYALPPDACNTFMVTYRELQEFENDLHKHVHLENNILFPKAAKL